MSGTAINGGTMSRFLCLAVFALCFVCLASAQTISPVIVEYSEKADGRFQIYNDADIPLTVVLEPHSFSVNEAGNATFRKLDPGIHVQLSSTSFRLAPKQTFFVFYKASAESLPSWFCIYATITGATTTTASKLALELPHTVYLISRKQLNRDEIAWGHVEARLRVSPGAVEVFVARRGGRGFSCGHHGERECRDGQYGPCRTTQTQRAVEFGAD